MGEKNIYFNKNLIKFLNDEEIEFSIIFDDAYDDTLKETIFNIKEIVFSRNGYHLSYQITELSHFCIENELIDDLKNRYKIFDPINLKGE